MTFQWFKPLPAHAQNLYLVGDIGGTNANIGLMADLGDQFDLILEVIFESQAITDFTPCVQQTLALVQDRYPDLQVDRCCMSGAGPVENNICAMMNQDWPIDGPAIERAIGIKTLVINDFSALSLAIPLLDLEDPHQVVVLQRADGRAPQPQGDLKAVVGAGTGLGVGFLTRTDGQWRAFASEAGHMDLADFDADTQGFKAFVQDAIELVPEYEMGLSGSGLKNLFYFFLEKDILNKDESVIREILRAPDIGKPALISHAAHQHPGCRRIMDTFVRLYARFVANVACFLLPRGGIFLAGGISSKNQDFFTDQALFATEFEQHCNPNIRALLREIPLYLLKDYSVSLYGAAQAARLAGE